MSTARELLLEIKRMAGGVNAPKPDETDALACLNRALAAVWGYGARLNSPVLYKHQLFMSETGSISVSDGVMRVKSVREHSTGNVIPEVPLDYAKAMESRLDANNRRFVATPAQIDVYPLPLPISADVVYMPYFTRLTERTEPSPFSPELDNAVIAMTMAIMQGGNTDAVFAQQQYGNAVSRYFRPGGVDAVICRGPW